MDSNQSSILWHLMQSAHENHLHETAETQLSLFDMLLKLRPEFPPKEQRFIDLMIKIREVKVLIDEINHDNT